MTTPTIKTREGEEPESGVGGICGICQRQISRYTCPSCNLFYCSLICYRSESHSQCSETFYRKELEIGINAAPSKTEEDKTAILELLKRIEDQSTEDGVGLFDYSDENEEDSLTHRFSAIDVSSASTDDLLRRLTGKEKDEFFAALRDPASGLVQELLESTELRKTRQLPWWEDPNEGDQSPQSLLLSHGVKPDQIAVPASLVDQAPRGISLLYNICAVCLAYSYVTRHLSMSPLASTTNDPQDLYEARRIVAQSIPFLIDHKSKVLHMSLADAITSFWSRLDPGSINNKTMVVLLEDIGKLMRPRKIVAMDRSAGKREGTVTADHPLNTTVLVISDMSALFSPSIDPLAVGLRRNHIVMKLTFYAAHILSTPLAPLHALADEICKFSMGIGKAH